MGQAAVDLPDPLEKPAAAQAGSADDLLAQLAGDEIDRLLAESDAGATPAPASSAPTLDAAPSDTAQTPAPSADASDAEARKSADEIAQGAKAADEPASDLPDTQTEASERAALGTGELSMQTTELPNSPESLPLILKPLVWLNSPLNYCPEGWREMVGKIAILTMVNAIAVLAYVIMFRRHH